MRKLTLTTTLIPILSAATLLLLSCGGATLRPPPAAGFKLVLSGLMHCGDGTTRDYTSARLKTQGLFSQAYGRFEARIKIPAGQGMWPAFWMLGNNITSVGWPTCGEIDIMENIGREPGTVHGSLHSSSTVAQTTDATAAFTLPAGQNFADAFHLYAVEWEPGTLRFYVDANLYATFTQSQWPAGIA